MSEVLRSLLDHNEEKMKEKKINKVRLNPEIDEPSVHSNQIWQFTQNVTCRSGVPKLEGSLLYVLRSTTFAPFGEIGPHDVNWACLTDDGVTVWSTLESCIQRGLLELVA